MGEGFQHPPQVCLILEDGTQVLLPVESVTLTGPTDVMPSISEEPPRLFWNNSFTIELARPTPVSRKRFIKLLMARGLQRNMAQGVAEYIRLIGQPYDVMSLLLVPGLSIG